MLSYTYILVFYSNQIVLRLPTTAPPLTFFLHSFMPAQYSTKVFELFNLFSDLGIQPFAAVMHRGCFILTFKYSSSTPQPPQKNIYDDYNTSHNFLKTSPMPCNNATGSPQAINLCCWSYQNVLLHVCGLQAMFSYPLWSVYEWHFCAFVSNDHVMLTTWLPPLPFFSHIYLLCYYKKL